MLRTLKFPSGPSKRFILFHLPPRGEFFMRERDCLEDSPAGVGDGHRGIVRPRPGTEPVLDGLCGAQDLTKVNSSPNINL